MAKKYKVLKDGFVWELISPSYASFLIIQGQTAVYILYPDGTESGISTIKELKAALDLSGVKLEFGIETPFRFKTIKFKSDMYACALMLNNKNTRCYITKYNNKIQVRYLSDHCNNFNMKIFNGDIKTAQEFLLSRVKGYYKRLTTGLK